ncbi:hypothetical protein D3C71_1015360 [compost metagenome]
MKKTVFQTDDDGLFLYPTIAHQLALSPDSFNIPYGAQTIPPPDAPAGTVARWSGKRWDVVQDHRGIALWISATGEPYSLGSVAELDGTVYSYPGWGPVPDWLTAAQPLASAAGGL